jgi:EAL domain-containing protein (putative c-di-GMP-specific phosphodiesterase class I)
MTRSGYNPLSVEPNYGASPNRSTTSLGSDCVRPQDADPTPDSDRSLARLGLSDLRPVYQPVVDLRDGQVVGYEALVRGGPHTELESPEELFAAARTGDLVAEFDSACREAAVRGFDINGSGPFALFLNADAESLGGAAEQIPAARQTVVIEITEQALVANPDTLLRALTRFRTHGWGVAIDDVGADSRSLALMPLLYPDVIKLDLRRLQERRPEDIARIVGAVGAESEHRQALVLAEGIDSEEQLSAARAFGAQLGQGFLLGAPAPLPTALPEPGRKLRLTASGGDVTGDPPFFRVTNWKRPTIGTRDLAERTAQLIMRQALSLGETAVVLAAYPHERHVGPEQAAELRELAGSLAFVGALGAPAELGEAGVRTGPLAPYDPLRGTWTVAALGPGLAACFVARQTDDGDYELATSYDRDLVVESALLIMGRLRPLAPPAR